MCVFVRVDGDTTAIGGRVFENDCNFYLRNRKTET